MRKNLCILGRCSLSECKISYNSLISAHNHHCIIIKGLVRELNNIILEPNFYDEGIFSDVLNDKKDIRPILEEHFDKKISNADIMRMVNKRPLYHVDFINSNKYLLMRLFDDEFESEFIELFESHLLRCAMKT